MGFNVGKALQGVGQGVAYGASVYNSGQKMTSPQADPATPENITAVKNLNSMTDKVALDIPGPVATPKLPALSPMMSPGNSGFAQMSPANQEYMKSSMGNTLIRHSPPMTDKEIMQGHRRVELGQEPKTHIYSDNGELVGTTSPAEGRSGANGFMKNEYGTFYKTKKGE